MLHGGHLYLTASIIDTSQIALSIRDTGTGMSPNTQKKIFDPLFTTKDKGIGLGLAISKNLIEINGGHITVDSIPDQGSTFTLTLPTA